MNRATNVLGFSLLAVAATLATMITTRNSAPAPPAESSAGHRDSQPAGRRTTRPATGEFTGYIPHDDGAAACETRGGARTTETAPAAPDARSRHPDRMEPSPTAERSRTRGIRRSVAFEVTLPAEFLAAQPPERRAEWQDRVRIVSGTASAQLARLTEQLDLTPSQRAKIYPSLVRSTPGYDPAMTVAGSTAESGVSATPDETVHAALDPEQQTVWEDETVDRQLWWQDIISRLEADLKNSTGGGNVVAGQPGTAAEETTESAETTEDAREAPESREDINLFDMLGEPEDR